MSPSEQEQIREQVSRDPYAASLGIELLDLAPGYCRAAMRLTPEMANFQARNAGSGWHAGTAPSIVTDDDPTGDQRAAPV